MAKDNKENDRAEEADSNPNWDLLYTIEERPPWYLCILLAFQQFLTCFGSTFSYPIIISAAICLKGDHVGLSELISTVIFMTGLSSFLQTTFGVRLPIIQSASYAFITPVNVIMGLNNRECPDFDKNSTLIEKGSSQHKEIWQTNLCELQGALMVAALFQIVIGFSGLMGFLMRFIGPLTIAPTISLIGLSLFDVAAQKSEYQWWICFMTVFLVTLFSQFLRNVEIPCPCIKGKIKVFALFPVLLGIAISWIICFILTVTDTLPNKPSGWGYMARTDVNSGSLRDAAWFRFPYPGQWGVPTVSLGGVLGMLAALIASMIESVGDYYACARIAGAPPPPSSAISRGIGMEGLTCLLSGAWGTGGGNTSYSENIGAIGITKVGSRIVIQIAGIIMILLGCLGKFGALFVSLPEPVVGGLFYVMFGMVTSVGISNLQFVDLNSTRNLFVFGFATFFGLSVPTWVVGHQGYIQTGNDTADQVLTVLCGTSMLVGGVVAFILDNTIPGTHKERGLLSWRQLNGTNDEGEKMSTYDLPLIQPLLNRCKATKYIPFCPGFVGDSRKEDKEQKNSPGQDDHRTDESIRLEEGVNVSAKEGETNTAYQPDHVGNRL